ncbi:MAG: protein TolR [Pseudomonadota bacterium]|nr:protein TolR [Pseudomonadota bacterium]MDE3037967.1 protein TolR [Pseudomonadota bacterium]
MAITTGRDLRKQRKRRADPFSEINVTPMVDVMLVLLVIFMVAAPMMTTGVTVDLPSSKAAPVAGQDEPLTVSITSDGRVYIQKTQVQPDEFEAKLKAITGEKRDTRIFVRGDKSADYGKIMQVVGAINAAGFAKVALITDVNHNGREK